MENCELCEKFNNLQSVYARRKGYQQENFHCQEEVVEELASLFQDRLEPKFDRSTDEEVRMYIERTDTLMNGHDEIITQS